MSNDFMSNSVRFIWLAAMMMIVGCGPKNSIYSVDPIDDSYTDSGTTAKQHLIREIEAYPGNPFNNRVYKVLNTRTFGPTASDSWYTRATKTGATARDTRTARNEIVGGLLSAADYNATQHLSRVFGARVTIV